MPARRMERPEGLSPKPCYNTTRNVDIESWYSITSAARLSMQEVLGAAIIRDGALDMGGRGKSHALQYELINEAKSHDIWGSIRTDPAVASRRMELLFTTRDRKVAFHIQESKREELRYCSHITQEADEQAERKQKLAGTISSTDVRHQPMTPAETPPPTAHPLNTQSSICTTNSRCSTFTRPDLSSSTFRIIDIDTDDILALINVNETYTNSTDPQGPIATSNLSYQKMRDIASMEGIDWQGTDLF